MRYNMVVLAMVLMVVAASSHPELRSRLPIQGDEAAREGEGKSRQGRTWPCCDRCGGCTKSTPAQCQCQDLVRSCHPSCRSCVRSPLAVEPPLYQCTDRIPNYCARWCEPVLHSQKGSSPF